MRDTSRPVDYLKTYIKNAHTSFCRPLRKRLFQDRLSNFFLGILSHCKSNSISEKLGAKKSTEYACIVLHLLLTFTHLNLVVLLPQCTDCLGRSTDGLLVRLPQRFKKIKRN